MEVKNGLREDECLFDARLLKELDWSARKSTFRDDVSPTQPGDNLVLRPLRVSDYDLGYIQLLSELTSTGDVSKSDFIKRFEGMQRCGNLYFVAVLEDTSIPQIIGSATLVLEQKFIHNAGMRGRVEDVVVNSNYRSKQLGKLLVETMTLLGKHVGCYKMSLECFEQKVPFYTSFGYSKDGNAFMVQRYKD